MLNVHVKDIFKRIWNTKFSKIESKSSSVVFKVQIEIKQEDFCTRVKGKKNTNKNVTQYKLSISNHIILCTAVSIIAKWCPSWQNFLCTKFVKVPEKAFIARSRKRYRRLSFCICNVVHLVLNVLGKKINFLTERQRQDQ